MVDLEKLSEIAMQIIASSGVAKSMYVEAGRIARNGDIQRARQMLKEGEEVMREAHDTHLQLLQKEAQENVPQVSMLVLHAEDQFMSSETIKVLVEELIYVHEQLKELRGK